MTASSQRCILALFAMSNETRPFVRLLGLRPDLVGGRAVRSGGLEGARIVAAQMGLGPIEANRTAEQLLGTLKADHVVVMGISGGIDPAQKIGDVVIPEFVIRGSSGEKFNPSPVGDVKAAGGLWTADHVVFDPDENKRLRKQGIIALDMETAAVAEVAQRHGVPWSVFRSISNHEADGFVDADTEGFVYPDGRMNVKQATRYMATHPTKIPALVRLGRDANQATTAVVAAGVKECRAIAQQARS